MSSKSIALLILIGILFVFSCKKESPPEETILNYQMSTNDSGIKAFIKQTDSLIEISAIPYELDPAFDVDKVLKFDSIRMYYYSDRTTNIAQLYDTAIYFADYLEEDGRFIFNYDQFITSYSLFATGSRSQLSFPMCIFRINSETNSTYCRKRFDFCKSTDPLHTQADLIDQLLDDGDTLIYKTFDLEFE